MSKSKLYRQCLLRGRTPRGQIETTTHLPVKFAKVGKLVGLKDDDFEQTWKVMSAGPVVTNPTDPRDLIKGHRKMTGDSTPRS